MLLNIVGPTAVDQGNTASGNELKPLELNGAESKCSCLSRSSKPSLRRCILRNALVSSDPSQVGRQHTPAQITSSDCIDVQKNDIRTSVKSDQKLLLFGRGS